MLVVGLAAVVLVASGCASSDPDDGAGDTPAASRPAVESGAIAPGDFATFVSSNPDAPLVNVHVPYEGHIEGTDSFVAFDEIGDWGGDIKSATLPDRFQVDYVRVYDLIDAATDNPRED